MGHLLDPVTRRPWDQMMGRSKDVDVGQTCFLN